MILFITLAKLLCFFHFKTPLINQILILKALTFNILKLNKRWYVVKVALSKTESCVYVQSICPFKHRISLKVFPKLSLPLEILSRLRKSWERFSQYLERLSAAVRNFRTSLECYITSSIRRYNVHFRWCCQTHCHR